MGGSHRHLCSYCPPKGLVLQSVQDTFAQIARKGTLGGQPFRWGPGSCFACSILLPEDETEKDSKISASCVLGCCRGDSSHKHILSSGPKTAQRR